MCDGCWPLSGSYLYFLVIDFGNALVKDGTVGAPLDGRLWGRSDRARFLYTAGTREARVDAREQRTHHRLDGNTLVEHGTFGTALDARFGGSDGTSLQLAAFVKARIEAREKWTDRLGLEFPLSHKLLLFGTRHKGQRRDGDDQETEEAMHGNERGCCWIL
jgi:hypothetical protein